MNWEEPITIVNNTCKTYLIGAMENPAKNDGGIGWRQSLTPKLNARGIYCFDPTKEEIKKVGMTTPEFHAKLYGWQQSGNWELFVNGMGKIWRGNDAVITDPNTKETLNTHVMGDVDYVEHSDFLIWHHEEGDKPGGTIAELVIAWYRGIPVYLLTDAPKSTFNKSLLFFLLDSGHGEGKAFKAESELLEYLDERWDLKKRKIVSEPVVEVQKPETKVEPEQKADGNVNS